MPRQQNAGAGRVRAAGVACEVMEATSGGYLGVVINTPVCSNECRRRIPHDDHCQVGQNGENI